MVATLSSGISHPPRLPRAEYPFESHRFEGLGMHYLDEGPHDGEVVVLLHGNPTWSFYFRKLVTALKDHYRVVVPDHLGMGFSDKPASRNYPYTLQRRVEDLEVLLDHLEIDEFTLGVHDWGGMIGMALAVRHPDSVRRLIISNTAAFRLPEGKSMPWQLRLARAPILGALLVRGLNAFSRGAVKNCVVRRPLSPEVRASYLAPYGSWSERVAVHRFVRDIPLREGEPSYALVQKVEAGLDIFRSTPTLLCWGLRDFVFDAQFLERWKQILPGAEVLELEDAGHFLLEDAPEEVVPVVLDFLNRHPLAARS